MTDNDEVVTSPWFIIAESAEECWSCGSDTKVLAILLPKVEDYDRNRALEDDDGSVPTPCSLSNIREVNEAVETFLTKLSPNFRPDYSGTTGHRYWMNHCEKCSAKIGDFYLHSKPGHAFFPITDEEIRKIKLSRIDISLKADAGWRESSWIDDLLEKAEFKA